MTGESSERPVRPERPAQPAAPVPVPANLPPSAAAAQQGATRRHYAFSRPSDLDRYLRSRNDLTERQRNAVELLLRGQSDQEVAAQIGVDRGNIFRWRKSVAFARELDRQRRQQSERSINRLQSMVPSAVDVLQKQLASDDPKVAMRAASLLLKFATPARLSGPSASAAAEKQAAAESRRFGDDLIAYINAPLPGQPGAPETKRDELEDEDDFDDEDDPEDET